jgi:hypothetical protein
MPRTELKLDQFAIPFFKSGKVDGISGSAITVTFATPFPVGTTVNVVVSAAFSNTAASRFAMAYNVSTTGFTCRAYSDTGGDTSADISWIAMAYYNP